MGPHYMNVVLLLPIGLAVCIELHTPCRAVVHKYLLVIRLIQRIPMFLTCVVRKLNVLKYRCAYFSGFKTTLFGQGIRPVVRYKNRCAETIPVLNGGLVAITTAY